MTYFNRIKRKYFKEETAEVGAFAESLREGSKDATTGTFDSVSASGFYASALKSDSGIKIPEKLGIVMDEAGKHGGTILKGLLDGISHYEREHGINAPADLIEQAIHMAYGLTQDARRKNRGIFDSIGAADSNHQDNWSLQPNRAVIAILAIFSEAVPFAHYLPADIGSNEAKLAIMSHQAGNTYGQYAANGLLDGANSGDRYVYSARIHECAIDGSGNCTGKLTTVQTDQDTCDAGAPGVKTIRGAGIVYVNGKVAARETAKTGTGANTVAGSVTIGGTTYTIGGTINNDTGDIALTTSPALPNTNHVVVEGFIDYERDASIVPHIISAVETYDLFARPWRVNTYQSIDGRTQMANELGLDPYGESVLAIQQQFANERHYDVIDKALRLSPNNAQSFNFDWANQSLQKTRAQVFQDFATPLGAVDQQMAIDTMNHGVTHLYVGTYMASMILSLPRDLFEPSGITTRPGIFRLGRLFGRYEVYYAPKRVLEPVVSGHQTAKVLCVGRATDVTRNPFILGDAVSPQVIPLNVGADLKQGAGFYARNFTVVNPHGPSSLSCAEINITNLT